MRYSQTHGQGRSTVVYTGVKACSGTSNHADNMYRVVILHIIIIIFMSYCSTTTEGKRKYILVFSDQPDNTLYVGCCA